MKQLIILLFTVLLVWSCSEEEHPTGVLIRVENSSSVDFEDILISSGASQVEFGKVAGEASRTTNSLNPPTGMGM
ncbi:hypothetical protein V8V91_03775 [Algoriphagus halophilus]|uniref:hypothetical protein n=1 Tax=Algoriphagus halophilus TaxID=226505 RepID=UPI00358F4D09